MCTPKLANRTPLQRNMKMPKEKENGSSIQKPSALQSRNIAQVFDKSAISAKPKNVPLSYAHKGLTCSARYLFFFSSTNSIVSVPFGT